MLIISELECPFCKDLLVNHDTQDMRDCLVHLAMLKSDKKLIRYKTETGTGITWQDVIVHVIKEKDSDSIQIMISVDFVSQNTIKY